MVRHSAVSSAMGFSQNTWRPARAAATAWKAWLAFGVQIATASTPSAARQASSDG